MTKDERLLVEIYKAILKSGKKYADPQAIGKAIGYKEHLIKNIIRGLMQANLVKGMGEDRVGLTAGGIELASQLMG